MSNESGVSLKFCTAIDDDIFLAARDAFEFEHGRWRRGSLKGLIEASLALYAQKFKPGGR